VTLPAIPRSPDTDTREHVCELALFDSRVGGGEGGILHASKLLCAAELRWVRTGIGGRYYSKACGECGLRFLWRDHLRFVLLSPREQATYRRAPKWGGQASGRGAVNECNCLFSTVTHKTLACTPPTQLESPPCFVR
jgi:hypothetical protein